MENKSQNDKTFLRLNSFNTFGGNNSGKKSNIDMKLTVLSKMITGLHAKNNEMKNNHYDDTTKESFEKLQSIFKQLNQSPR